MIRVGTATALAWKLLGANDTGSWVEVAAFDPEPSHRYLYLYQDRGTNTSTA